MGALSSTKPQAWTLSPQMTAAPELWRDCLICAPFWESSGTPQNIVGSEFASDFLNAGWGIGSDGVELDLSADASGITFPLTADLPASSGVTIHFLHVFVNISSPGNYARWIDTPGEALSMFQDGAQSTTEREGEIRFQRDGQFLADEGVFVDKLVPSSVTGTHPGGTGTARMYVDGEQRISKSWQATTDHSQGDKIWIGRENDDSTDDVKMHLRFFALWRRELSPSDIDLLARDPFAMLRPAGF